MHLTQSQPPTPAFTMWLPNGAEFMRVEANGDVFVRGTKVDSDRKVYECFREWMGIVMPKRF